MPEDIECPECHKQGYAILDLWGPTKYICSYCSHKWGKKEEWNPSERDRPVEKIDYN